MSTFRVRQLQVYLAACANAAEVRQLLRVVDAQTLLRVFLRDPSSAQKILDYARSATVYSNCTDFFKSKCRADTGTVHGSDNGLIKKLAPECLAEVVGDLNIKDRIAFGRTCKDHRIAITALVFHEQSVAFAACGLNFAEVRLLLLATQSLVGGCVIPQIMRAIPRSPKNHPDFYIDRRNEERVVRFLDFAGGFRPVGVPIVVGQYSITTLRSSTAELRVFGCPSEPILGVLLNRASHKFGFCDANTVYHAYPQLLDDGVVLTTPAVFRIAEELEDHIAAWTQRVGWTGERVYGPWTVDLGPWTVDLFTNGHLYGPHNGPVTPVTTVSHGPRHGPPCLMMDLTYGPVRHLPFMAPPGRIRHNRLTARRI
ncbi:hypothetical protein B0H15DRAFT_802526 [Mycena belliarum]|uniref:Uncharacterized protein n=1 Tax=Mycena belliarum TaxID=1033014 RepID=A0AAD6XPQ1_9AGAR|nr:hypothetical protein B0H15DRAFT_802526 [Mycena belliae]